MNQGNDPRFAGDDGVWQDGGLLLHFPASRSGSRSSSPSSRRPGTPTTAPATPCRAAPEPGRRPPDPASPTAGPHRRRAGQPGRAGARGRDRHPAQRHAADRSTSPAGSSLDRTRDGRRPCRPVAAPPGAALSCRSQPPVQLGNKGGMITLLDADGLKVDGVAYTGRQAAREGWTIVF